MPMWAARFLEISAGSTSMWMMRAFGAHSAITVESTRSSKRTPTARIASESWKAKVEAAMPCMPGMPTQSGWLPGKPPSPIRVVVTGIWVISASVARASAARAHLAGDRQERHRVHVGVGDRGHQVGGAGARGGGAHPHPPGHLRVALGHVAGALLVADQERADRRVVVERVEERDHRPAGN